MQAQRAQQESASDTDSPISDCFSADLVVSVVYRKTGKGLCAISVLGRE